MFPTICSFKTNNQNCRLPPQFIIEVLDNDDRFMVCLTCDDHKQKIEEKLLSLQTVNLIPKGKIVFTDIKIVHTNCIKGTEEDIEEISMKKLNY